MKSQEGKTAMINLKGEMAMRSLEGKIAMKNKEDKNDNHYCKNGIKKSMRQNYNKKS